VLKQVIFYPGQGTRDPEFGLISTVVPAMDRAANCTTLPALPIAIALDKLVGRPMGTNSREIIFFNFFFVVVSKHSPSPNP
jgi:hypothetical protein